MKTRFIVRDGNIWPVEDEHCYKAALGQVGDLNIAIDLCKEKRVAIQAGGNCGIWPKELAKHFKWVYTFEPDADNFSCLVRNAPESNIIKMQAIVGEDRSPVALSINSTNIGAHHVSGDGVIPSMRIDDLNLAACDLIQLDIEGYELNALKGARHTLQRHGPVLMLEDKRHGERYGVAKGELQKYLKELGYKQKAKVGRDIILTKE